MRIHHVKAAGAGLALLPLALLLSACGGGGGSSSNSPTSTTTTGSISVAATDAPADGINHAWVTVKAIALHTSANQTWSANDTSWIVITLPTPQTVDLAALTNGGDTGSATANTSTNGLSQLLSGQALPAGSYRQMRIFLAGAHDKPLGGLVSNDTEDSTGTKLAYDDQVETISATLSGGVNTVTYTEYPLDIPYPSQGIKLNGNFTITAGSDLKLAIDFNLDQSLVQTANNGFVLSPNLNYYDLSEVGAIKGNISTSALCPVDTTLEPTSKSNCAYNLVVKAELSDGVHHYDARATDVNPKTGNFTLFPVKLFDSSGNPLTYDVVIRGRQMDTAIVTGVTPTALTAFGGGSITGATVLQSGSITPVVNTSEYQADFTSGVALSPLTSGFAVYQQTLTGVGGGLPYSVRYQSTDPYTGYLPKAEWLENGPVQVAPWASGGTLSFTAQTPVENTTGNGTGGYTVGTNTMPDYFNLSPEAGNPVIVAPATSGTVVTYTPASPTLQTGISSGTVSLTLNFTDTSSYDTGYVVLSHNGNVVTTQSVTANLASGGPVTLTSIPAGTAAAPVPDAEYYGYVVVWNSAHIFSTLTILPIPQLIDLRNSNTFSSTISLDGTNAATGI